MTGDAEMARENAGEQSVLGWILQKSAESLAESSVMRETSEYRNEELAQYYRNTIATSFREHRKAKNLTQEQVAEAMGKSLSRIRQIERGEVEMTIWELRQGANVLGCEPSALCPVEFGLGNTAQRNKQDIQRIRELLDSLDERL